MCPSNKWDWSDEASAIVMRAWSRAVVVEWRCAVVDQRCRESEGKAKIEGYMSVSDEDIWGGFLDGVNRDGSKTGDVWERDWFAFQVHFHFKFTLYAFGQFSFICKNASMAWHFRFTRYLCKMPWSRGFWLWWIALSLSSFFLISMVRPDVLWLASFIFILCFTSFYCDFISLVLARSYDFSNLRRLSKKYIYCLFYIFLWYFDCTSIYIYWWREGSNTTRLV